MKQPAYRPIVAVLFLAWFGSLSSCVSNERYEAASTEVGNLDSALAASKSENERLRAENTRLTNDLELMRMEKERLQARASAANEVDDLRAELSRLRDQFSNIDDAVTVRPVAGGTALSVEGQVLFRTGSDEISPQGQEILMKIARRLQEAPNALRVEGHTDNVPVRATAARYPMGNLQLSGARALRVAHYLVNSGGLSRDRVSFSGYGEERPVATNESEQGRAQNRRVEIVVLD